MKPVLVWLGLAVVLGSLAGAQEVAGNPFRTLLALGQELEVARPRFDSACEWYEEMRYTGDMAAPWEEQTQVDCHGALVLGSHRKVELMFNEGVLEFLWVLVASDELESLETELVELLGPVIHQSALYRVFESGTVALRHDPPEILIATPEIMQELTGFQEFEQD